MPDTTDFGPALAAACLYAGLNALIAVWLSVRVVRLRRSRSLSLGDGGQPDAQRAIRAHGNFVEYAPLGLVLVTLIALTGAPPLAVHLLGLCLTAGRLCHAWHFVSANPTLTTRAAGMILTYAALALGGLGLVGHALTEL